MNPIRTVPLSITLPALVAATALLGILLPQAWQYRSQMRLLEERIQQELTLDISRIQGHIERELRHADVVDIRGELTSFAIRPQVVLLALTDERMRILASSRLALEGRPLAAAAPHLDPALYRRALRERRLLLRHDPLRPDHWLILAPVRMPPAPGRLRPDRQGLVYLDYDFGLDRAGLSAWLISDFLLLATGTAGVILLLLLALRRLVNRPLHHLRQVADRIAAGDLDARTRLAGSGELYQLARDLDRMAERIGQLLSSYAESSEHLLSTLRSIGDGVIVTDLQGRITRMNPCAERLTGWPMSGACGRQLKEVFRIVDSESRAPLESPAERALREGRVVGLAGHTTLIARDGGECQIADSAAPIKLPDGKVLGVILVFQDVTEEHRLRRELELQHGQLRNFASALPGIAFVLDEDGTCLEVFGSQLAHLAYPPEQMLGRRVSDLPGSVTGPMMETIARTLRSGQPQRIEYQLEMADGVRWFEGRAAPLSRGNGRPSRVAWLALDITEQKKAAVQIEQLAYYDPLTGLPNRRLVMERLQHELQLARRSRFIGALMFLDVDRFKTLNDALGHETGDLLLKGIASRLAACLREEDTVGRLGGDEFTVLLPNLGTTVAEASRHAGRVAAKLREAVSRPYELNGRPHLATISLGITLFPADSESAEDLLRQADAAMYLSKSAGRNTISFYRPELQLAAEQRLQLENDLRHALKEEAFGLHYQPQCDREGRVSGMEALVRWSRPGYGAVPPAEFIPVMEENGTIVELGQWVLRKALEQCRLWQEAHPGMPPSISVNISSRQFQAPGLVDQVRLLLDETGLAGDILVLELTESILLKDLDAAIATMRGLRDLGVRFSIDDFGTGYSSLRYLRQLPLDEIKIDRSFIHEVEHKPDAAAIVEAILAMASHLQLTVIAEGVETKGQLDFLIEHGCGLFQGWYFHRPLDAAGITELLGQRAFLPEVQD